MKYIFFEGEKDSSRITMSDLEEVDNVDIIYRDYPFNNRLLSKLFRFHMSQKVKRYINLPFKELWFKSLLNRQIKKDEEIYFVFVVGWFSERLIEWLKLNYPNSKNILFLRDTVNTYEKLIPSLKNRSLSNDFDLVISYDPGDAKEYGFLHSSVFLSRYDYKKLPKYQYSDITFVGVAKDRLSLLHSLYKKFTDSDLIVDFHIMNSNIQKYDNIAYSNKPLSYLEYLGKEVSSNCLLEVVKGDSKGSTLRCWEAVYYNKKLLTNWSGIKNFQFYDPRYMFYFKNIEDIDIDFIRNKETVNYKYNNENSPKHLLKLIRDNV